MKQIAHLLCIAGLLSTSVFAGTAKVSGYTLDIEFSPQESLMHGLATITFTGPLKSGTQTFYLHGELNVESISMNGQDMEFETGQVFYDASYALVADRVSFKLDRDVQNAELTVSYQGYFHPSAARSPSDYMRIGEQGVLLRSYYYSLWFPVFLEDGDDVYRADFPSVRFKIPSQYQLVFIGEKTAEKITEEHVISEWSVDDVKLSDLQVTAQKCEILRSGNINIYHYKGEESSQAAMSVADFTAQLLGYYSKHYRQNAGIESLNLLEMPKYGDISSHNMVGVSSETFRSFDTAIYAKRTIAHELVHPFVSVQVSRADPLWALAIEGFPSYFHLPALRKVYGQEFYDDFMLKVEDYYIRNKGVEKDRWNNPRPPEVPLMKITADNMSAYKEDYILWGRTKLFFNYLLSEMGDENFVAFTGELFERNELNEAEFVALCKKHLPEKQAQVDTWLYSNDYPREFRLSELE